MENNRSALSLNLREIFLLITIFGLVLAYFVNRSYTAPRIVNSKASYSEQGPLLYRYWHQDGDKGSGTGQIGSGDEWKPAIGIDLFDDFIILHQENGMHIVVQRENLKWFHWRSTDKAGVTPNSIAPNAKGSPGH